MRATGKEPQGYTLPAYAAVQLWAQARQAAGADNAAIAARISSTPSATILGPVSFDAKGDTTLPGYAIYAWQAATFTLVN